MRDPVCKEGVQKANIVVDVICLWSLGLTHVVVDGYLAEVVGVEEAVDPLDADREAQGLGEGRRHEEHGQPTIKCMVSSNQ